MPEIVSDEYREGYEAFTRGYDESDNPYLASPKDEEWFEWERGYETAFNDWAEMIGEKSV